MLPRRTRSLLLWLFPTLALALLLAASQRETRRDASAPGARHSPRRGLTLQARLPDAGHIVASPEHNPPGATLSTGELAHLQALVDRINAEVEALQGSVGEIARSWARQRIEEGSYASPDPEEDFVPDPGAILVRVAPDGGALRDVQIHPGECPELDVLVADVDAVLETGRIEIERYLRER